MIYPDSRRSMEYILQIKN